MKRVFVVIALLTPHATTFSTMTRTIFHDEIISSIRMALRAVSYMRPAFRTRIKSLFSARGPSNISRLIIAVVVYSVDAMVLRWSFTNVVEKCQKIVFPFFAHCYAASAIISKLCKFKIIAALLGVYPSVIFRRSYSSMFHLVMIA